jgi:multicomponent K+:H+ antiporter subunit D
VLAVTMEAFAIEDAPEPPVGVGIPAALAFLGLSFATCALLIAGLPPLSGFIAKFTLLHALLHPALPGTAIGMTGWTLMALLVLSGLTTIIAMMRFGVRTFWAAGVIAPPRLQMTEAAPVTLLLLLCVAMTVQAGPVLAYLERASDGLHQPAQYIHRVLSAPVVPSRAQHGGLQ